MLCTLVVPIGSYRDFLRAVATPGSLDQDNSEIGFSLDLDISIHSKQPDLSIHLLCSQTSRLLTSSLYLGVPVPRTTQCIRDV
jgi:hypothetical protein